MSYEDGLRLVGRIEAGSEEIVESAALCSGLRRVADEDLELLRVGCSPPELPELLERSPPPALPLGVRRELEGRDLRRGAVSFSATVSSREPRDFRGGRRPRRSAAGGSG